MSVAMEDFPRRHRITVDEYHHMAKVGLLAPDARVELIEGEIIDMPPIGSGHMSVVNRLTRLLVHAVGERAIVQCQRSIRLGNMSEPQPDFAVLAPRDDFYERQTPIATDTLLVIEVSDTTLRYDSGTKLSLYARYGIPEFWIFNVEAKRLQLHRNPSGSTYDRVVKADARGTLPIAALPGVSLDLSSLFR